MIHELDDDEAEGLVADSVNPCRNDESVKITEHYLHGWYDQAYGGPEATHGETDPAWN